MVRLATITHSLRAMGDATRKWLGAAIVGMSLEEFTTEASSATQCGPHGRDTKSLAGEPAELRKFECGGIRWHQVTALHGGRGYLVWVTRPLTTDFLESFSFTD